MNDRFTFRIWSKERQKYEHPSYIEETSILVLARLSKERYTVEQCTGLKDKNGRLIYENDVVKITGDVMTMPIKYMECLFKVIWADIGFCFEMLNENDGLGFCECFEYEVIGNIHENPELLEDK